MEYGNNGGRRYITIHIMRTNLLLSKASGNFKIFGLTDATSEPLLCIFILATKCSSVTYVKGLDYHVSIPYDSSNTMELNIVEGNAVPGFPVCKFRGKLIPVLMYMSPKGSIIFNNLTEYLKYLDQLNFFQRRKYGPSPFRLLDGHGSRLHLPFLE